MNKWSFARWHQCALPFAFTAPRQNSVNTCDIMLCWTHQVHIPMHTLISLAIFAQLTAETPYILHWAAPFPLKIVPCHGGSGPLSNIFLLGSTQVHNPNISVGSAVFAGLKIVTDRSTDRPGYSVCNNRLHLCTRAS